MFDSTPTLTEKLNSLDDTARAVIEAVIDMCLNGQRAEAEAFIKALMSVMS